MKGIISAIDKIEDPSELGKEYSEITGHLIFDIKFREGFRRKARFVADDNKTESPNVVTLGFN